MAIPSLLSGATTATQWPARRRQLLDLLAANIYGYTPDIVLDESLHVAPLHLTLENGLVYEAHKLFVRKGDAYCSMRFEIFYRPQDTPQPAILMIDVFDTSDINFAEPGLTAKCYNRLGYEQATRAGYASVFIHVNDLCNDCPRTYTRGIMEIAPREGPNGWGAISAWAWAASRVVDVLWDDPRFDNARLAVVGVSRAGKTALWCGAQDERLAVVIACVSGCGGASLLRGKTGEHIRDMAGLFPHWTCEAYASYADREDDLPVDQHMLLALCAPRPLYLSDAIEDSWADPHKAFEAAKLASEAWQLLGRKGLVGDDFPPVDTPLQAGDIGYHVRTGGHGLLPYDWECYLTFLKKYFG